MSLSRTDVRIPAKGWGRAGGGSTRGHMCDLYTVKKKKQTPGTCPKPGIKLPRPGIPDRASDGHVVLINSDLGFILVNVFILYF